MSTNPWFKYSHTIEPQQPQNDDLDNLFKIGDQYIKKQQQVIEVLSQTSQKSEVKKQKRIKKDKQRKEKKEKKHKKKQKKQRKQKRDNKNSSISSDENQIQIIQNVNDKIQYRSRQEILNKILTSDFLYNQRLDIYTLPISVIKFPQSGLYQYGISTETIPRYRRINHNTLVGMKSSKQTAQIIKQLNIKINQTNQTKSDQDANNRYFLFKIGSQYEVVRPLKTKNDADPYFISFDHKQWALPQTINSLSTLAIDYRTIDQSQSQILKSNKQYNLKLSQQPNNISLWINFIDSQEKLMQHSNKDSLNWLNERKISILEKAIKLNPQDLQLKIKHLELIFQIKADNYRRVILMKIQQLLKFHPANIELWQLYLHHKWASLSTFNICMILQQFAKIKEFMTIKINEAKSAILVWNIRKALLKITKQVINMYNFAGYYEIATGICSSLLQFNIFTPSDITVLTSNIIRIQRFKKYWNNIHAYRVGQIQKDTNWSNVDIFIQKQEDCEQFIGRIQRNCFVLFGNQDIRNQSWRIAKAQFDNQRIIQSPVTYVLFDDIEPFLYAYKDKQNIQNLIDVIFQSHGFPPVFNHQNSKDSSFSIKYLKIKCQRTMNKKQINIYQQSDKPDFWLKFWHQKQTSLFLSTQFITKFIYLKRILKSIRGLLSQTIKIDLYLLFFESCIYTTPELQTLTYSQSICKQYISQIIQLNSKNIQIWVGYIYTQQLKLNNYQQCYSVYVQLLQSIQKSSPEGDIFKLLYYFLIHTTKWQIKVMNVIAIFYNYLKTGTIILSQLEINAFQILEFHQLLAQKYISIPEDQLQIKQILKYFVVEISSLFEPSGLLSTLNQSILKQCESYPNLNNCLLILRTNNNIRTHQIQSLSKSLNTLIASQYIMKVYNQPIFMLRSYLKPSLQLWLSLMCYLKNPSITNINYFIGVGKQILQQNTFKNFEPSTKLMFVKLLQEQSLINCLIDIFPYCRDLFLILIKQNINIKLYEKLLEEKGLRF